ncbi:hypothetical protein PIB30_045925 [Stylosanthes scabra]|uniref:Zinc finger GRF-type domain-containing protein n=1 Tax=Stylosanthes scabra TaxID=79078 RepID=A0ABU6YDM8_9FABA|nr:hypothetical protein [Stylosanthes scabra]
MKSDKISSRSRPSAGGGRSERSSSTQGVFAAKVRDDSDGANPKCKCGVYDILYLSRTATNSNKLFFGCSFFKYTEKLKKNGKVDFAEKKEDASEHFSKIGMEN